MKNVFVTVGNDLHSFHRLIAEVDEIGRGNDLNFAVQYGYSSHVPSHVAESCKFLSRDEFYERFLGADVIISHAGIGTVLDGIHHQKKLILVPRQKKFDEHFNDHQSEIAREVEGKYENIAVIYDTSTLKEVLGGLLQRDVDFPEPPRIASLPLVKEIKEFIANEETK